MHLYIASAQAKIVFHSFSRVWHDIVLCTTETGRWSWSINEVDVRSACRACGGGFVYAGELPQGTTTTTATATTTTIWQRQHVNHDPATTTHQQHTETRY